MQRKTVGILGGSFNPVHHGHLMLASYLVQWGVVDEVWLTLSPRNPLKNPLGLIPDTRRLAMLSIATRGVERVDTCDIELSMPLPSYTINTLDLLASRYPGRRFKLVIGSDNWQVFDRWAHHDRLLSEHDIFIYPRPDCPIDAASLPSRIHLLADVPQFDVSATDLRRRIAAGQDVSPWMPPAAHRLLIADNPYRKEG